MEKRQQREVWTWELVAEFAQRLAPSFVTEEHAGGGLYDEVVLYLPTEDSRTSEADLHGRTQIRMNREGRLHVQGGRAAIALDVWSELDAGIPAEDLVDRALEAAGRSGTPLATAGQSPMTTALRAMRMLLARAVARYPGRWEWRMGVHDSSGGYGGVGVRAAWFDGFAQAREDNSPSGTDPFRMSEYRFWFLLHEGVPVLAAQPSAGLLYTTTARLQAGHSSRITVAERALDEVGCALAEQIAGPVKPFRPGKPLPGKALWFTDHADQRLVVVVTDDATHKAVDKAFAYALAWQHDRDLLLLLPARWADRVLYRLPWIATPVRVWTISDDSTLRPAVAPTRDEVLAHAATWPVHPGEDHDLGENHAWVSPLLDTVDAHWALTPAHRHSYRAWHCEGLQVLRLKSTAAGIEMRAGVQYSNPKPHQPEPMIATISAPMTPAQRASCEVAIARAVADRLNNLENANIEHRLQAALAAARMPGLALTPRTTREYPAWRPAEHYRLDQPAGSRGFLDFLGIDRTGRIHVVETKVGGDGLLVLQALDYLIWVTAQTAAIRDDRGWSSPSSEPAVQLDLVLAAKGIAPALGPYTAPQLDALSGDVRWRVFLVADIHDPRPEQLPEERVFEPRPGRVATPVRPQRFRGRRTALCALG